jgi:hypothetical protein
MGISKNKLCCPIGAHSRTSVSRKTEALRRADLRSHLNLITSFVIPFNLQVSTTLQFKPNKVQIILGLNNQPLMSGGTPIERILEVISASIPVLSKNAGKVPEILIQESPSASLKFDPIIVARTLVNSGVIQNSHSPQSIAQILRSFSQALSGLNDLGILGIRIEIKGLVGKMTMRNNKVVQSYGSLKLQSSSSVIHFGQAKSIEDAGGVFCKVWIAYQTK